MVVPMRRDHGEHRATEELFEVLLDGRWVTVALDRFDDVEPARCLAIALLCERHRRREEPTSRAHPVEASTAERPVRTAELQQLRLGNGDPRCSGELVQHELP